MLDNEVRLGGTVERVTVSPQKDWVNGSLKLKTPTVELWVKVAGLSVGDKALERLEKLPGAAIVIRGRMSSYDLKAKPPDYPVGRTVWELSMGKDGYLLSRPESAGQINLAFFVCKVRRQKVGDDGRLRVEVGIRYARPKTNDFGTHSARVRCPEGTVLVDEQEIFVHGRLQVDTLGALVDADTIVTRP